MHGHIYATQGDLLLQWFELPRSCVWVLFTRILLWSVQYIGPTPGISCLTYSNLLYLIYWPVMLKIQPFFVSLWLSLPLSLALFASLPALSFSLCLSASLSLAVSLPHSASLCLSLVLCLQARSQDFILTEASKLFPDTKFFKKCLFRPSKFSRLPRKVAFTTKKSDLNPSNFFTTCLF